MVDDGGRDAGRQRGQQVLDRVRPAILAQQQRGLVGVQLERPGMVVIGLTYTNIDQDWFQVFLGTMLLLAVIFNNIIRKRVTGER